MNLSDYVSPETVQKPNAFSSLGRTAQRLHPEDLKRWHSFVLAPHKDSNDIPSFTIKEWLCENGWDSERASECAIRFNACLELLDYLDHLRGPSMT